GDALGATLLALLAGDPGPVVEVRRISSQRSPTEWSSLEPCLPRALKSSSRYFDPPFRRSRPRAGEDGRIFRKITTAHKEVGRGQRIAPPGRQAPRYFERCGCDLSRWPASSHGTADTWCRSCKPDPWLDWSDSPR